MTAASGLMPPGRQTVRMWRTIEARAGFGTAWQTAIFLLALLIVFSRLPGALLHPQFFAEDGWVWYQQAYNLHWLRSLGVAQAGYLQTLPRLVTGVALLFPMQWAPLIMNLAGATIQVLPVNALLSYRCAPWGPLRLRILMAALYLAVPNAPEVHIVLTNAMWHLAILQALLAFSVPPATWRGRLSDALLFAIASISGPFTLLLLPCVIFWYCLRRALWTRTILCILLPGLALQLVSMTHAVRAPGAPLGITWIRLLRIVAGNIFINSMTGGGGAYLSIPLLLVAAASGLAIMIWGWRCATLAFRLYVVFAVLVLMACLRDPLLPGNLAFRWEALANAWMIRYWLLPSLMFLWSGAYCAIQGSVWKRFALVRFAGWSVVLLSTVGIGYKWVYPAWPASHYGADVQRFKALQPGEHMLFEVYDPLGRGMELVKH